MLPLLEPDKVEAISKALGDTDNGLSGTEIVRLLAVCGIADEYGEGTKWKRLNHNFWNQQCRDQSSAKIENFILQAMSPSRHLGNPLKFEVMRENLNKGLSFIGLFVDKSGSITQTAGKAKTISEAEIRAQNLREDLQLRNVHSRILYHCRAELLANDYFHAAQEAVKCVFDRLRECSCIDSDGHDLVERVLQKGNQSSPALIINNYLTESERSEQNGFANMLKGIYGMFRNPTAHELRTKWTMPKEDAEDLLSMVSLVHRRLDQAQRVR